MQQQNDITATVKEIKQSFRLLMNGVTAQSMREKGLDYHINWGANLLHLREMAADYTPDHRLAQELWKEDVRECKILATMLMPQENFEYDLAMLWIEQTRTQEIAEIASMNLYQHLPYATELALQLISSPVEMKQLHGFTILARVFSRFGTETESREEGALPLSDRDINEFLDQTMCALSGDTLPVKHSAMNALQRFANIDETCLLLAKGAVKSIKMDDWFL